MVDSFSLCFIAVVDSLFRQKVVKMYTNISWMKYSLKEEFAAIL